MKINIDGNVLLRNMMFWGEKTDDDCIEMATTNGKLDAEQALINMIECEKTNKILFYLLGSYFGKSS